MSLIVEPNKRKASVIEDLSHLKGIVKSSLFEEEFPIIGKTYTINKIELVNERRCPRTNQCIPRRGLDAYTDILKVHLFGWTTEEDMFESEVGFNYSSFIYSDDSDSVYRWFRAIGINIRRFGFSEILESIYKNGTLKKKRCKLVIPKNLKSDNSLDKTIRDDSKPGGYYYDKPYYGLVVKNERVVEKKAGNSFTF